MTEEGRQVEGVYVHYRPRRILHISQIAPVVDSLSSRAMTNNDIHTRLPQSPAETVMNKSPHSDSSSGGTADDTKFWSTVTVMNAFASSYVLSKLLANTEYEVFLAPFSDTETGQPTALLTNVTSETGKRVAACLRE